LSSGYGKTIQKEVKMTANYKVLIGGEWHEAASGERMEVVNPANGRPFATVPKCGPEDVERAVKAAVNAGPEWAGRPVAERSKALLRLSALIRDNVRELAELETMEQGSPLRKTLANDIPLCAEHFEYFAGAARGMTGETLPLGSWCTSITVREPLGVVGLITPWNFPAVTAVWKMAAAIVMGNTCVVKPPSIAPLTVLKIGELAMEAGIPVGVINVITGPGSTVGEAMVRHPDVAKIGFTGDSATGKRIMSVASDTVKPLGLELGGKNPFIVLADADLDCAVEGAVWGAFFNSGQVCAAASRFYVHESLYEGFSKKFVAAAAKVRVGDPMKMETVMGPLAYREHRDKVEWYITEAKKSGATLLLGGDRPDTDETRDGFFVAPTIFGDCSNDMTLMREEVFGPVAGIAPFRTVDEAVSLANDTRFGLSGSVWTRDVRTGLIIAGRIKAGTVWVNEHLCISSETPWGGCGESGWGKDGSPMSLEEYTLTKYIYVDLTGRPDRPWYGVMK
jgi:acyl-CoA reductase-like NAD-dependent aldehyde dehydrogenase